jgi:AcrR family transcriptional regulator
MRKMAWDTEGTRRKLRKAAAIEFAAHGFDGASVQAIADRAGVNRERLYSYFGDKRTLWDTVLASELEQLAASVAMSGATLEDIGEFAGATFDYHAEHPELARLLQWEGLQGDRPADEAGRTAHYREKVARFTEAQKAGVLSAAVDPAHTVFALIALAAWWQTVPQLATMITAADPGDQAERARRRAFVVEAARRLAGRGHSEAG